MKLIDLLVQELPKRGGWPEGVHSVCQGHDCQIESINEHGDSEVTNLFIKPLIESHRGWALTVVECNADVVTREEYQAAIAASQQPAWNGEGLPPVGCECEWCDGFGNWVRVEITYLSEWVIVVRNKEKGDAFGVDIGKDLVIDKEQEFRTIRTEAECKRQEIIECLYKVNGIRARDGGKQSTVDVYEAIASGKIPGVKLTD